MFVAQIGAECAFIGDHDGDSSSCWPQRPNPRYPATEFQLRGQIMGEDSCLQPPPLGPARSCQEVDFKNTKIN